ncbi:hypothetical protein ABH916_004072 [Peribacillus frigoritolerans]
MLFFMGCTFNSSKILGTKRNKRLMLETQFKIKFSLNKYMPDIFLLLISSLYFSNTING